ncbi:MAG: sulfite exporter TauE/SafE family protein [Clostridia bacterium]|nr:sulfite exporter TauE/SafE family protein [Clostridia bacterium]
MKIISIIVAFIISVLSGLGVGGGGLFVIYLALFTNTPQLTVQGINLAFFLFSASASLVIHLQKRRIFFLAVCIMSLFGIAGAIAGSFLSSKIDESLLRKAFGVMLVLSGSISLFKKQKR